MVPNSSPSFMSLFTDGHNPNLFAPLSSSRPSALTLDPSSSSLFLTTASLSPSAPLPDPSAPTDDPFDLLSAVAGPLPLSSSSPSSTTKSPQPSPLSSLSSSLFALPPPSSSFSSTSSSTSPPTLHHHRSLSTFLSTAASSSSSPIPLFSLFPSVSLPLTSPSTPPPLRPRSLEHPSASSSSPLSTPLTSFDFFSLPSPTLSPPSHSTSHSNPHPPLPPLSSHSDDTPEPSEQLSFFSPIFWQPSSTGKHHRTLSSITPSTSSPPSSTSSTPATSQPSSPSPYVRSRSNSNSTINPFVFTPTTQSLPPPTSISPFAGAVPTAPTSISPLSSTSSGSASDTSPSSASPQLSPALPPSSSSSASTPSSSDDGDKQSRMRVKIVNEILSSETKYVESLSTLLGCFIQPLSISCREDDRPIVSEEQLSTLSSNIHAIAQLNAKFLSDIQERVEQWTDDSCMGPLFVEFAHYFKIYTWYVGNHDQAVMTMQQLDGNARWREFLLEAMKKPRVRNLPLSSFLILPIQRIPRYKLLLQELLKHTPPAHPDHASLHKALGLVSTVAAHVNDSIRVNENRAKVRDIQSQFLTANFVSPSRRFIRSGHLTKQCRSSTRTYLFVLFNDLLVYASKLVVAQKYKVHNQIDIDSVFRVVDIADTGEGEEPHGSPSSSSHSEERKEMAASPEPTPPPTPPPATPSPPLSASSHPTINTSPSSTPTSTPPPTPGRMYKFKVLNSMKSFIVMTPDAALKQQWLHDLRLVIAERKKTIQLPSTSPFSTSSHAPMFVGDNASSVCQRCDKKFSLTVRKHHCRSCGRLCCSECVASKMMVRGEREVVRVCWKCAGKEEARLKKKKQEDGDKEKFRDKEKDRERDREKEKDKAEAAKAVERAEQKDILGLL